MNKLCIEYLGLKWDQAHPLVQGLIGLPVVNVIDLYRMTEEELIANQYILYNYGHTSSDALFHSVKDWVPVPAFFGSYFNKLSESPEIEYEAIDQQTVRNIKNHLENNLKYILVETDGMKLYDGKVELAIIDISKSISQKMSSHHGRIYNYSNNLARNYSTSTRQFINNKLWPYRDSIHNIQQHQNPVPEQKNVLILSKIGLDSKTDLNRIHEMLKLYIDPTETINDMKRIIDHLTKENARLLLLCGENYRPSFPCIEEIDNPPKLKKAITLRNPFHIFWYFEYVNQTHKIDQ